MPTYQILFPCYFVSQMEGGEYLYKLLMRIQQDTSSFSCVIVFLLQTKE